MCGLVGIAGKIEFAHEKVFKRLLTLDVVRGEHSTGVASVPRQGEVKIAKQVGCPHELFNDKRYDQAMAGTHRVLIGHNRHATKGAVNKQNAHPFTFGKITGAHNGSLSSYQQLEDASDFHVDSQALLNHIDKKGLVDMISKIQGAYALTYWDSESETMNFIRNDERPLFIASSKGGERCYWASEKWMLDASITEEHETLELPINTLLSFKIDSTGNFEGKPVVKTIEYKKKVYTNHYYNAYQGESNVHTTNTTQHGRTKPTLTPSAFSSRLGIEYTFEVVGEFEDERGMPYYLATILDPVDEDNVEYRIYPYNSGKKFFDGEFIKSSPISFFTKSKMGVVYRLSIDKLERIDVDNALETVMGEIKDEYPDHHGNLITRKEWEKKYGICAWCTADISPEDTENGAILSTDGESFCQDCSDKVRQYVRVSA